MAASPVTTEDTTPTLIASYPVNGLSGSSLDIQGFVQSRNVIAGYACNWQVSVVATNLGTQNASISFSSITPAELPSSMSGSIISATASGNVVSLWASDLAATQFLWTPSLVTAVA